MHNVHYINTFFLPPDFMQCFVAYCVVAVESAGRQVPIAFLERVKDDFSKRYGGGKAATAVANSLNREFGYIGTFS